jgi:N,N'-diacetyllegionaminate synthase
VTRTTVIAETAQAHDGSLGMLHAYIDAVRGTGADAIKFQTHIADAESSPHEPFRVKFSRQDETRFAYWKRMEFSPEHWRGLKSHCDEAGLEFISSPFSVAAVELLESLGVGRYKIASGEISNFLMLEKIARTGKPVLLSTGMSSFDEIAACVKFFRSFGSTALSILQCTTAYPAPPEKLGLNVLQELRERFDLPVGLSDHSGTIFPSLAAVTLGASVLEIHVTFHKAMFGPDVMASVTIEELATLVRGVRFIETALANPVRKDDVESYRASKTIFGKSLAVNKDMRRGAVVSYDDLESKKPLGRGIPASEYRSVLGRRLNKDLGKYTFLTAEDLE